MPRTHRSLSLRRGAALFAAFALTTSALAHEFWISPRTYRPQVNTGLAIELHNGHGFPGEKVPRDDSRIALFAHFGPETSGPSGGVPIVGRNGDTAAGLLRVASPGPHVLAYRNTPKTLTLDAAKFESYLKEEGLDAIVAERAKLKESAAPGREAFSRAAKAIVHAGEPADGAAAPTSDRATTPVGLTLELTPTVDPARLSPGQEAAFVLTRDGRPLADTLVRAVSAADAKASTSARTDASGVVRFPLASAGVWLINAVHMTRAAPGGEADWESVWASLTFEITPPPATPAPKP